MYRILYSTYALPAYYLDQTCFGPQKLHNPNHKNTKLTHIIRTDLLIANWFSTETCVVGAQKTYQREGSLEHKKHILTLGSLIKMQLNILHA